MVTIVRGGFKGAGVFSPSGRGFAVAFERQGAVPLEALAGDAVKIRGASKEAVDKTTNEVKQRIRDFIDAHFAGSQFQSNNRRKVSNASAQSKLYDELEEKGQYASLIYSKFGKRDGGGFVDFLLLHVRGGTIRPGPGEDWLRIENKKVPDQVGHQNATFSNSSIFMVESADGKKLFQLRRNASTGKTQLLATLVKSIAVPARLAGVEAVARTRGELFEGHFARALALQDFGVA